MANPDFTGLLVIPSIPMVVIVYVGIIIVAAGGTAVYLLNRNVLKREAALPVVTTAGITSPLWSLAYESPQVFHCALCMQSQVSIRMKVYYSKGDPQTLLVVGTHRCPAHTAHVSAVQIPRRKRLRRAGLLHMGGR